jgi:hypothetical protein
MINGSKPSLLPHDPFCGRVQSHHFLLDYGTVKFSFNNVFAITEAVYPVSHPARSAT